MGEVIIIIVVVVCLGISHTQIWTVKRFNKSLLGMLKTLSTFIVGQPLCPFPTILRLSLNLFKCVFRHFTLSLSSSDLTRGVLRRRIGTSYFYYGEYVHTE